MERKEQVAAGMLRTAMGRSIRTSLASTADRLQKAASALRELEADVDLIGLPPRVKGHRPVTAEGILAEALTIVQTNAPDLRTLAQAVADYNREMNQPTSLAGPDRCRVLYANQQCGTEHLPGVAVCFEHLWATARGRGVGNVFPLGSPEPTEKAVPHGVALVGENGVHWLRQGDRWHAGGPVGDGGFYRWDAVNGAGNETGRELARLVPECVL